MEAPPDRAWPRDHLRKIRDALVKALPFLLLVASGNSKLPQLEIFGVFGRTNDADIWDSVQGLHVLADYDQSRLEWLFLQGASQWKLWLQTLRDENFKVITPAELFHFEYHFHDWFSALVWVPPF